MNDFERALLKYFSQEQLRKLQGIHVGIAGAGGLGSNCAFNLARCGFKRFTICDFDTVELSNLNRQFYFIDQAGLPKVSALRTNLLRINPAVQVDAVRETVTRENVLGLFSGCDAVVEAFDDISSKQMITEAYMRSGKFFIAFSGIAGYGDSDGLVVRRVTGTFHLIGDMRSEASEHVPPCSPRVNVAAAKGADILLEWGLNS